MLGLKRSFLSSPPNPNPPIPRRPTISFLSIPKTHFQSSSHLFAQQPTTNNVLNPDPDNVLRAARQFKDYNIREYAKRRTVDAFRSNQHLDDQSSVASAFSDGVTQLEITRRQAVVYSLNASRIKSVTELHSPHRG